MRWLRVPASVRLPGQQGRAQESSLRSWPRGMATPDAQWEPPPPVSLCPWPRASLGGSPVHWQAGYRQASPRVWETTR